MLKDLWEVQAVGYSNVIRLLLQKIILPIVLDRLACKHLIPRVRQRDDVDHGMRARFKLDGLLGTGKGFVHDPRVADLIGNARNRGKIDSMTTN